jgi:predicted deacylase
MPRETLHPLRLSAPGTERHLRVLEFGPPSGRPLVYIQASIHADEIPALALAHRLEQQLTELEAQEQITGRVRLVPVANPVGLDQVLLGRHQGRFEFSGGVNFNRNYPELGSALCERLQGKLSSDAESNTEMIRAQLRALLQESPPQSADQEHKRILFEQALDADMILDLHCDDEALLHLYTSSSGWEHFSTLAERMRIAVVMLADDSGGASFDEALPGIWTTLQRTFPDVPIPAATVGCTIELRGENDVEESLIHQDSEALLESLRDWNVLKGPSVPLAPTPPKVVPLEAVDFPPAPVGGVVLWKKPLGSEVKQGELLAEIWVPGKALSAPVPIHARCDGLLFVRAKHRYVLAGKSLGKVCGSEPLPWRKGYLLNA